jgi:transaldolase/glucose-6-phosphate isomerase
MSNPQLDAQRFGGLGGFGQAVHDTLDDWRAHDKVRRLWARDASLWSGTDEGQWLGWLEVANDLRKHPEQFAAVGDDVKQAGFKHAVLLGMGGSSLCPEVLRKTFGVIDGFPEMHVLDSTVPAQVARVESAIDIARTLFIVSSKSGGTTEPNVFKQYFFDKVVQAVGAEAAGSRFVAITDPGTKMQKIAHGDHFRQVFFGVPTIGGRFSALSNFGMIPAAVMGLDVPRFLAGGQLMEAACGPAVSPDQNPGVALGALLGTLAKQGLDKVTILASPAIDDLGAWLEQLIAESTGKQGKGLIPIAGERVGPPTVYGNDRVFAYLRLTSAPSAEQDAAVDALEHAGHPVARIAVSQPIELGQEFFRWEIATAVAGSILGINAFNQPDVEAAKVATRTLTAAYEEKGSLPPETPILKDDALALFADPKYANALAAAATAKTPAAYLAAHLGRIQPGDYFAITAYVEMDAANDRELQALRHAVRDAKKVATTLGYGPRFLHSTGQLHKGGPNRGVFLQVTSDDTQDLPIPGQKYSFGILKRAQAQGDFQVLAERDRRLLRVHLGADVRTALARLREMVEGMVGPDPTKR